MKTNFIKKLATLALSVFAIGSFAQCPTMSGIYVQQGTGTADVAAMMTPSTSVGTGWFNWTVSPSAYTTPVAGTNNSMQSLVFSATGIYTVCAYYTDSTTMCSASTCTTINVTSVASNTCNAAFSAVTSSNTCMTYFTNASTGTNLTYQWYKPGYPMLSNQANPTLNLGNGSHLIVLYTFSNGQFCDSTSSVVNVSCPTSTVCNAVFSTYTDASSCFTHFYNNSTGSNLTYKWYELPGMTLLSTASSPVLSLGTGNHTIALYSYSSGQFCDSTLAVINVNCNPSGCNAAFTNSLSGCTNYLMSTSTGSGLTYEWRNMTTFPFPLLSTQSSFTTSLPAGNNLIALYVYSGGQFCDSTTHVVSGCNTNTTSCQANSQFTVFADSVNAGNYFAYNQSTGTGAVTYLWNFGDGSTSTQQYPFHQYATPGQYVICLTVTATSGSVTCSDVSCDSSSVHRISSAYLMNKIQVMPQGPTAVKENTVLKNLSVYPNPVENELTVEVELTRDEKIAYVITDALGKVVAKNELTSAKTVINTATLDRGIYFLSVTSNDQVLKTTKLMK